MTWLTRSGMEAVRQVLRMYEEEGAQYHAAVRDSEYRAAARAAAGIRTPVRARSESPMSRYSSGRPVSVLRLRSRHRPPLESSNFSRTRISHDRSVESPNSCLAVSRLRVLMQDGLRRPRCGCVVLGAWFGGRFDAMAAGYR